MAVFITSLVCISDIYAHFIVLEEPIRIKLIKKEREGGGARERGEVGGKTERVRDENVIAGRGVLLPLPGFSYLIN